MFWGWTVSGLIVAASVEELVKQIMARRGNKCIVVRIIIIITKKMTKKIEMEGFLHT